MKMLSALSIAVSIIAITATSAYAFDATSGRSDRALQDAVTSTATLQSPAAPQPTATPAGISADLQINPTLYREHINAH